MKNLAFIIGICLCAVVSVSFTPKLPTTNQIEVRIPINEDCTFTTADGKKIPLFGNVKIVEYAPDFTVRIVESGPDFTMKFVDTSPGIP